MSLINDVLRDLQNRRQGRSGLPFSAPGVRPVATQPRSASRRLSILAVLLCVALLAGYGGWRWMHPFGSSRAPAGAQGGDARVAVQAVAASLRETVTASMSTNASEAANVPDHAVREPAPEPTSAPADESAPAPRDTGSQGGRDAGKDPGESSALRPVPVQARDTDAKTGEASAAPMEHGRAASESFPEVVESSGEPEMSGPESKNLPPEALADGQGEQGGEQDESGMEEWNLPEAWTRPGLWDENPPPREPPQAKAKGRFSRNPAENGGAPNQYQAGLRALEQGRRQEAEARLRQVLRDDSGHEPAREALLALLLGQQRRGDALRLLADDHGRALLTPRQILVYARLLTGEGKHAQALRLLDAVDESSRSPEHFALLGAVLQHLKMPEQSALAYRQALRGGLRTAVVWAGLGIALEAGMQREEAREAYRQAMAAGIQDPSLARYVNSRLSALPHPSKP